MRSRSDSEWEGFEKEAETHVERSLQPFALPALDKPQPVHPSVNNQLCLHGLSHKPCITEGVQERPKSLLPSYLSKVYPKIPIMRVREHSNTLSRGLVLYKGFEPRFSDKYFSVRVEDKDDFQKPKKDDFQKPKKDNLVFDSKFQCGNLNRVVKRDDSIYDLYLRVDTNTQGHLQWYYFSVTNTNTQTAVFNIFRFKKKLSLYQRGMRPYVKSKREDTGWKQAGLNIQYWNPAEGKDRDIKKKSTFILTFEYEFRYDNDEIMFAACPPYSYTYLNKRLKEISCSPHCTLGSIGETLCGLNLPLVTVGDQENDKFVVVSARTHPGETSGSWVMDGLLTYLASERAQELLKVVTFKVVPMLNPDGVWMGNYRTGIIGKDFNRCFNDTNVHLLPELAQMKQLIRSLQKKGKILLYLDLHGHSIQRNSFIFGPEISEFPQMFRTFIDELSLSSTLFKQSSCKLKTRICSVETARGFFQNIRKIFSLTIENSLGLYETKGFMYTLLPDRWKMFGREVGEVLSATITTHEIQLVSPTKKSSVKTQGAEIAILNRQILDKIQKRTSTEKSDNMKPKGKKKFQLMRWKRLNQLRNSEPNNKIVNCRERMASQGLDMSDLGRKNDSKQDLPSDDRNHSTNSHSEIHEQLKSQAVGDAILKRGSEDSSIQVSLCLKSTNDNVTDLSASNTLEPRRSLDSQYPQEEKAATTQHQQDPANEALAQKLSSEEELSLQFDRISEEQSQSSDINDHENRSEDLGAEEMESLIHFVEIINKTRHFQLEDEAEDERHKKLKEVNIDKERMVKQASFNSAPHKMEVYHKFNEIKLNLSQKLGVDPGRRFVSPKSQRQRRRMDSQEESSPLVLASQSPLVLPSQLSSTSGVTFCKRELPVLEMSVSKPESRESRERKWVLSRPSITTMYKVNVLEQSIREEILVETSKRLQRLQEHSIFSSKPFNDQFTKMGSKSKPRHLDFKRKL